MIQTLYIPEHKNENISGLDRLLSVQDVRDLLGLSAREVIRLVQERHIPAYRLGGSYVDITSITTETRGMRFRVSDVENFLENQLIT